MAGMAKRDVQGRVGGVNENGVNIDGTWFNYSKFFQGERNPARGASVTAVISDYKGKDYLNELTVIGSALPNGSSGAGATAQAVSASGSYYGRSGDTDKRIARQVALKAAVEFSAFRHPDAETSDVTDYARQFEGYLNEPFVTADIEDAA